MYVTISDPQIDNPIPSSLSTQTRKLPETRINAGTHLFHEGDRVERIYQVLTGVVRLTRILDDGRRQIIAFGFPGDIVGFPCDGRHHTDCEPLTPTRLQPYRLSQVSSEPDLHDGFIKAALREIAAMQDHFMMLGRKTANEKVASFLTVLSTRIGTPVGQYTQFDMPMCRADVADFLGLTTETVSRTLSQLRKSRVIALDGIYTVIVLRPEALQALAEGIRD